MCDVAVRLSSTALSFADVVLWISSLACEPEPDCRGVVISHGILLRSTCATDSLLHLLNVPANCI
jgi:hypothetical protein